MVSKVTKWGNSLAIPIPESVAQEIALSEGTDVDLQVIDGNLVIKVRSSSSYSLEELVSAITPENCHQEQETGVAVGNELW